MVAGGALAAMLATLGVVAVSEPAAAAATVDFTGRGYGHGRGLSQYGAKGRAQAGQTAAQILAAYYPGTTAGSMSDGSAMTVWITGDTDNETWWRPEPGMTLASANGSVALPAAVPAAGGTATAPTLWRLKLTSLTFQLDGQVGGVWYPADDAGVTDVLDNVVKATVSAPDSTVQLVTGTRYREYRGTLSANRVGSGSPAPLRTTVTTYLGSYLASVVPSEMPASWPASALEAQAVAARTYAVYDRDVSGGSSWYDTCDSTQCQVYTGIADYNAAGARTVSHEDARSTAAVTATAGHVRHYGGQPAFTQFSASNGGYSLGGTQPYLVAAADPYDAYSWTASVDFSTIQAKYPAIGSFVSLSATRDGRGSYGGRTVDVTVTGSAGSVTVTGDAFRSALGLKSTLWTATRNAVPVVAPQRDWNGGGADLIVRTPSGRLYLSAGLPGATWAPQVRIGHGWTGMKLMTQIFGFDGTGKPELVTIHTNGRLYLYPGDGKGGWGVARSIGRGWANFDMLIGTYGWQQAGKPGFIVRRPTGELILYPGSGKGGWGVPRQIGTGWNAFDIVFFAGDWNGDGKPDLIAREKATGLLFLYPGTGTGTIGPRQQIGHGWGGMNFMTGGADWDRDGCYDVLARDGAGSVWLYPGDCGAGFGTPRVVVSGWGAYTILS